MKTKLPILLCLLLIFILTIVDLYLGISWQFPLKMDRLWNSRVLPVSINIIVIIKGLLILQNKKLLSKTKNLVVIYLISIICIYLIFGIVISNVLIYISTVAYSVYKLFTLNNE